jgi:hypothetical protein
MKVKELIENLRITQDIEIREDNYFLCDTTTTNKTIEIFKEREVIDWFAHCKRISETFIVINIKGGVE